MIAVSLKEGDELVDLFLRKGADVNATSQWLSLILLEFVLLTHHRFYGSGKDHTFLETSVL
jgi:hypothetical protein